MRVKKTLEIFAGEEPAQLDGTELNELAEELGSWELARDHLAGQRTLTASGLGEALQIIDGHVRRGQHTVITVNGSRISAAWEEDM